MVAFSENNKRIITASYDKSARIWDVATQKELSNIALKHKNRVCTTVNGAFEHSAAAVGGRAVAGQVVYRQRGPHVPGNRLLCAHHVARDGPGTGLACRQSALRAWSFSCAALPTRALLQLFSVAWSRDGKWIALGGNADVVVRVWATPEHIWKVRWFASAC